MPALAIDVFDSINLLEAARIKKFEEGRLVGETKSRDKISGKTKLRTNELLAFDRSDPNVTTKYHFVQEYDATGQPVGEPHEHTESFPAKRIRRR